MTDRAREEMAALCEGPNPNITSALAEQHRLRAVYTAIQRSKEAVSLTINVGARLPLFHSAIGRAILVGLPEKQRQALVDQALAELPDERKRTIASLDKGLRDYEEYGLCTGFGEWKNEVHGIAVPVFSLNGDRVHGLNVGGPSFFVHPDELMEHYAERLKKAAQKNARFAVLLGAILRGKLFELFQSLLGFRMTDWSEDYARFELPVTEALGNRYGIPHGGVYATLLDTVMGFAACYTGDPENRWLAMTLSLNVNYLAQPAGSLLIAEGRRTGGGRKSFFADALITDDTGIKVAAGTGVFRYRSS